MTNGPLCRIDYVVYRNEDWRDDMTSDAATTMILDPSGPAYVWAVGATAQMLLKINASDGDSAAALNLNTGAGTLVLLPGSISTRVPSTTMVTVPAGIYQHQIRIVENGIQTVLFYGTVEVRP